MEVFRAMDISATGLAAERLRMDVIADNLANAGTTRTAEGGPYRRKVAVFAPRPWAPGGPGGVQVAAIAVDPSPPRLRYEPGHPDANAEGYVAMPNVDVVLEMADLIAASRAYEANVTAFNAAKAMFTRALDIGRA